jgi:hypothetical protein
MLITLYNPGQLPLALSPDGFSLPNAAGLARISDRVAEALGCSPSLVDVLDTGPSYVAYSIFDGDGPVNQDAMHVLSNLSGHLYDPNNEDEQLRGNILIVTSS